MNSSPQQQPSNSINDAVGKLRATFANINGKLRGQIDTTRSNKEALIQRISAISNSVNEIKNKIGEVKNLKQRLDKANADMLDINKRLEDTQTIIKNQEQTIAELTTNIEQARKEIERLINEKNQADETLENMTQQKEALEAELTKSRDDMAVNIKLIDDLNTELLGQVGLIDDLLREFNIDEPLNSSLDVISSNITEILRDLNPDQRAGRRKLTKKHRKQRGGYTYSSNKMLDKSSSIISNTVSKSVKHKRFTNKNINKKGKGQR